MSFHKMGTSSGKNLMALLPLLLKLQNSFVLATSAEECQNASIAMQTACDVFVPDNELEESLTDWTPEGVSRTLFCSDACGRALSTLMTWGDVKLVGYQQVDCDWEDDEPCCQLYWFSEDARNVRAGLGRYNTVNETRLCYPTVAPSMTPSVAPSMAPSDRPASSSDGIGAVGRGFIGGLVGIGVFLVFLALLLLMKRCHSRRVNENDRRRAKPNADNSDMEKTNIEGAVEETETEH